MVGCYRFAMKISLLADNFLITLSPCMNTKRKIAKSYSSLSYSIGTRYSNVRDQIQIGLHLKQNKVVLIKLWLER